MRSRIIVQSGMSLPRSLEAKYKKLTSIAGIVSFNWFQILILSDTLNVGSGMNLTKNSLNARKAFTGMNHIWCGITARF